MDVPSTAISILLSVALVPHLTAIIVATHWPGAVKGLIALALSIALAVGQLALENRLDWGNLVVTAGIVAVAAHYFYMSISKGFDQVIQENVKVPGVTTPHI